MSGRAKFESDLILSMMINPVLASVKKKINPQLIAFIDYIRELMDEEQKAFSLWKSVNQFDTLSHEISLIKQIQNNLN